MKHRTLVFQEPDASRQIAVELWEDYTIEVMIREHSGEIWSMKWDLVGHEGDPVQISFEREA